MMVSFLQRLLQRRVIRLALPKDSTITLFQDWAFSTPPNRFIISPFLHSGLYPKFEIEVVV